jgi:hypothetical protein
VSLQQNLQDSMDPDTAQVEKFCTLFEMYVDDFINLAQMRNEAVLWHHTRALLKAIHSVFPPATGNWT